MSKSNKKKKAQNVTNPILKINEPVFEEESNTGEITQGNKKLLAQKEKERKEEEQARLQKEQDTKKKNNKTSGKTKTKQNPPKNKDEPDYETPKSKNRLNEDDEKNLSSQKARSSGNLQNVNIGNFQGTGRSNEGVGRNSSGQVTGSSKKWQNEDAEKNVSSQEAQRSGNWRNEKTSFQENTIGPEADEAWDNNLKNQKIGKPNYSYNKQPAFDGNKSFGKSNYHYTFSDGKNDEEFQKFLTGDKYFSGKVREETGDLFHAPKDYSLAHCVAEDFSMGAGIAKEFKAKFKRVAYLLDQKAKTGGLAFLQVENRFIYYLVTKPVSRGKPTLYTLWKSLIKMRNHITEHKVSKLAIPQIGCGLDRLDWIQVKRMLEYVFSKNEIDIVVYILGFNADETPTPSKPLRKCFVVHAVQPLTDIQTQTGLIFLGSEDGTITHEIDCLAEKYNFMTRYKTQRKSIGEVLKFVDRNEYLYGLIIRRTINNQIIFADFEKCLFALRKQLKADETVYIGIQGFVEKEDKVITEKLVNLMQYILQDVEIWVCWPNELAEYCPSQKY